MRSVENTRWVRVVGLSKKEEELDGALRQEELEVPCGTFINQLRPRKACSFAKDC